MHFRRLNAESATVEALAPYAALVAPQPQPPRFGQFYGDRVELWSPGRFISDADTVLSVARVHPRPLQVIWMERHFKHTQTFIPLGGKPFVIVLSAPNSDSQPDPSSVRAFHCDGSAGVMLHVGTWHEFPFSVSGSADFVVILRQETQSNLEVRENDEALGDDLEKRNLQVRLGYGFEIDASEHSGGGAP
jgi:ureidoglycolate lyase